MQPRACILDAHHPTTITLTPSCHLLCHIQLLANTLCSDIAEFLNLEGCPESLSTQDGSREPSCGEYTCTGIALGPVDAPASLQQSKRAAELSRQNEGYHPELLIDEGWSLLSQNQYGPLPISAHLGVSHSQPHRPQPYQSLPSTSINNIDNMAHPLSVSSLSHEHCYRPMQGQHESDWNLSMSGEQSVNRHLYSTDSEGLGEQDPLRAFPNGTPEVESSRSQITQQENLNKYLTPLSQNSQPSAGYSFNRQGISMSSAGGKASKGILKSPRRVTQPVFIPYICPGADSRQTNGQEGARKSRKKAVRRSGPACLLCKLSHAEVGDL